MSIIWIIFIIILFLMIFFMVKAKNTSKKIKELEDELEKKTQKQFENKSVYKSEPEKKTKVQKKEKENNKLIKSKTCSWHHPCVIHLYTHSDDKDLHEVWEELIKEFDKTTYRFSLITDPKIHMGWKVEKLPTLRSYGSDGMCDPAKFKEFTGKFDNEYIKKFIIEN
ncbi:putative orfan [Tupanvirus soda lake]|uniref:Orfan n=2 Tax=Tupanvirus TaxID=2094720 RepID=A0AC62ABY3_9VIRU|nr:putative orfan [Tupanvirus soda lake]QKU35300.1 putative orfan [Tupanvirus soda lake]